MIGYQFEDGVTLTGKLGVFNHRRDFAGDGVLELHPALAAAIGLAQGESLRRGPSVYTGQQGGQSRLAPKLEAFLEDRLAPASALLAFSKLGTTRNSSA